MAMRIEVAGGTQQIDHVERVMCGATATNEMWQIVYTWKLIQPRL